MSRYLRNYLIVIVALIGACFFGLWAVGAYGFSPRSRMLVLIVTAAAIGGYTRLFWAGRRDGD